MDEGVFIVAALVICLALLAGLYFVTDRLSDRVLALAAQARAREQNDITNHERLARVFNDLVDETTLLADALKNERILRSQPDAVDRLATKKAAREAAVVPPPPGTNDTRPAEGIKASACAARTAAQDSSDDVDTRVLSRPDLQVATRPAARLTPHP